MLAFVPRSTVRSVFGNTALGQMNNRGPKRVADLLDELELTRQRGFSIDDEDLWELRTVGDAVDYVVARAGGA